ncbi:GNAT family N-acetyltransferase [Deinococcus sp.]|uniref:GNAT family N-acetyltransferase n=1 Tax=Deinococcus sp. TaxID=47478 RepID=UPI002869D3E8|nr:GNAT family N-acetyltransferase [Deinococcus sp.]
MNLHTLSPGQLDAVSGAFVVTFNAAPWNEAWTHAAATSALGDLLDMPRASALAAWEGKECVGAILGRDRVHDTHLSHEILELFVRPSAQRQGVGQALVGAHLAQAEERGIKALSLLTARDSPAEAFYAALGFRRAQRMVLLLRP